MKNHTFGLVRKYPTGALKAHQGWDFFARIGTPFYAIASGEVLFVSNAGDYGLQLCHSFEHRDKTYYAFYAHLHQVYVKEGQRISGNQELGRTGDSGNAWSSETQGQHLHLEIRSKTKPGPSLNDRIDPIQVFGTCPLDFTLAG